MKRAALWISLVLAAACGPVGAPCERACLDSHACPPGEPHRGCEAALADCLNACEDP